MIPVSDELFNATLGEMNISNFASATIRQIVALATNLQEHLGEDFIHLEMGNPGLPASQAGILAEQKALASGVANVYPNISGIPQLKQAGSDFLKAFFDVDIPGKYIVPTVGSMQATFTLLLLMGQRIQGKDTILFLDPGFPAQHHQVKVLGLKQRSIDIYECRGEGLEQRMEVMLADGRVTAIIYSNPNNPAWTNLTETEFKIIARMAEKHDLVVIEDNAYLGMDFRRRYGVPFTEPFIPTLAKYSDRTVMLVSASKIFSYAGQRIAMVCMSPAVADRAYKALADFYDMPRLIDAYIFGVLYCASSGTAHSAQHAFAEMMRLAVNGELDFVAETREYGRRAGIAKKLFTDNGFHLVYARDGEEPISDGFFFTVGYPGMTGEELQSELLKYGVATISLPSTGSRQQGLRVCVSMINTPESFETLGRRLSMFHSDHKK